VRRMVLLLVLAMALPAAASPGKVKKATRLYAAYEDGDDTALAEAIEELEPALEHKKVVDDAAAWALYGHLLLEVARSDRSLDSLRAASDALAAALERSPDEAVASGVLEDLKATQGLLLASMEDALAGKRVDEAYARLEQMMAVRSLLSDHEIVLRGMEERLLRLAIIVAASSEHYDAALTHHEAFFGNGWFDAGLASMVATGLAGAGRVDEALAFLGPLREEFPGDARLLRAEVELHGDDREAALAAVEAAEERLWPSVSGALLLADLYRDLQAYDQAVKAYEQVLTLSERHRDAMVRAAVVRSRRADAVQATLDEEGLSWRDKRDREEAIEEDRSKAVELLEGARELDSEDRGVLEHLVAAYQAAGDDEAADEARAALDALETP